MNKPLVLFFDLDGTLTESAPGIMRCFRYALDRLGISPNGKSLRVVVGPPLRDSFLDFGVPESEADLAVSLFREEYVGKGAYECSVFPGIKELLESMKEQGIPMAIVTSKPTPEAKEIAKHFGLAPYFEEVFGSSLDGKHESKELIIQDALVRFPLSKYRPLMIGDTPFDMIGAEKSGIQGIEVSWGYGDKEALKEVPHLCLASSPEDLKNFLFRIKQ